jgi:hypothetical protein
MERKMEQSVIKNLQKSIINMRAKVIAGKGQAVEGLSPLPDKLSGKVISPTSKREANS